MDGRPLDGPRYSVSLQDRSDLSLYREVFESEVYQEAKTKSDEISAKEQRSTIIFDRKDNWVIDKNEVKREGEIKPIAPVKQQQSRRGRKKKEEEPKVEEPKVETPEPVKSKKVNKNAYFE